MWPDYAKEPLEIFKEKAFEVYDPWEARIVGVFQREEDAELFLKAFTKRAKKRAEKVISH